MDEKQRFFVLQYPFGDVDLLKIRDLYQAISQLLTESLGDNNVLIAIPNIISFHELTKEQLQEVRGLLDWALENKDDTNSETGTGA